jgi:hypothetical protein
MPGSGTLDPLDQLISEIADLQKAAIQDLMDRRNWLSRELARVDAELAELTGEPMAGKKARAEAIPARQVTLPELIVKLEMAPHRTLNIRKANLEAKHIKALAKANPRLLKLGGKGAWPTVTLLKPAGGKAAGPETLGVRQEDFSFKGASSAD